MKNRESQIVDAATLGITLWIETSYPQVIAHRLDSKLPTVSTSSMMNFYIKNSYLGGGKSKLRNFRMK